jgi:hypothetical protein
MLVKKSHLFFSLAFVISLQFCQSPITSVAPNSNQNNGNSEETEKLPLAEVSTEEEIYLPVIITPLLAELNQDNLSNLNTILNQGLQSWFDLAGLDKKNPPPRFSPELQSYRERWINVNPRITPFLGLWSDGEDPSYYLSIFPSATAGKMCILEFKPEWSLLILNEETGEYNKDIITEQILSFSLGEEKSGQFQSSQISTSKKAIITKEFSLSDTYPVELIAVLDDENNSHVLASTSPPILPPDFPDSVKEKVNQTLSNYGCTTEIDSQ